MRVRKSCKFMALGVFLVAPAAAIAAEACCPSDGNGITARAAEVTPLSASSVNCCPSDGDGIRAATGFGQASPNAINLSALPEWRVFVFQRDGVRYVQVNDTRSNVHAAVASSNGVLLILPMGSDSVRQVIARPPGLPAYEDSFVVIVPLQLPDGTVEWQVKAKL